MANGRKHELEEFLKVLRERGFVVELTRNGHHKIVAPDGQPFFHGSTPRDFRSLKNLRSTINRHLRNLGQEVLP